MGPELVIALAACLVAVVATVVGVLVVRAERRRQARLDQQLQEARTQVQALEVRLDTVSAAVAHSSRPRPEREYVVTTLGEAEDDQLRPVGGHGLPVPIDHSSRGVVTGLEDRLLGALARHEGPTPGRIRRGAVEAVVRALAAGHGLSRALRPEVLDRAAAEAYVARRRSRRTRRQELREARRLVRVVRAHELRDGDAA